MARVLPEEFEQLELRAHSLLADVPLHDVWMAELAGGGPDRSIADLRPFLSLQGLARINLAVRFLFGLRSWLGRLFSWDSEPAQACSESFLHRLTDSDREQSLVAPGTSDGAFRVLFVSSQEAISEIHNSTVHAFTVFVLLERPSGYLFYMAIYVRPLGFITSWYMALIDPFRRYIIYPAILRHVRAVWVRGLPEAAAPE